MDEIMSNENITWTNTTNTTDCANLIFTSGTSDTNIAWDYHFEYTSWLPYTYEQYDPKWHIEKGYKYQIKHMWD